MRRSNELPKLDWTKVHHAAEWVAWDHDGCCYSYREEPQKSPQDPGVWVASWNGTRRTGYWSCDEYNGFGDHTTPPLRRPKPGEHIPPVPVDLEELRVVAKSALEAVREFHTKMSRLKALTEATPEPVLVLARADAELQEYDAEIAELLQDLGIT